MIIKQGIKHGCPLGKKCTFPKCYCIYVVKIVAVTRDKHHTALNASHSMCCSYHLGTIAFGSLILTICRIIRLVLEYLQQKLKKYDNAFVKAVMCCLRCFFWCLEKFIRFINRNAYIMCAVHGKNFCMSARDAFGLLMRNVVRVVVLDKVSSKNVHIRKLMAVKSD